MKKWINIIPRNAFVINIVNSRNVSDGIGNINTAVKIKITEPTNSCHLQRSIFLNIFDENINSWLNQI